MDVFLLGDRITCFFYPALLENLLYVAYISFMLISFTAIDFLLKFLFLYGLKSSMAGVLELIGWPIFRGPQNRASMYPLDPKVQELEIAKEILAEVFDVSVPEVEEMIRLRLLEC
jgi:hypothetical protein